MARETCREARPPVGIACYIVTHDDPPHARARPDRAKPGGRDPRRGSRPRDSRARRWRQSQEGKAQLRT